ncbi:Protein Pet117 mitochondrial, partial [Trinorchestia longiramus]
RDRLHAGVVRDIERQQQRKMENIAMLNKQADLARELK